MAVARASSPSAALFPGPAAARGSAPCSSRPSFLTPANLANFNLPIADVQSAGRALLIDWFFEQHDRRGSLLDPRTGIGSCWPALDTHAHADHVTGQLADHAPPAAHRLAASGPGAENTVSLSLQHGDRVGPSESGL